MSLKVGEASDATLEIDLALSICESLAPESSLKSGRVGIETEAGGGEELPNFAYCILRNK